MCAVTRGLFCVLILPDDLDECSRALSDCGEFAECADQPYNLRSFEGEPYACTCMEGFIDEDGICVGRSCDFKKCDTNWPWCMV